MSYVQGFVAAVPVQNRDAYIEHCRDTAAVFLECGALRVVETWAEDVPHGQWTDFYRAVQAGADEAIIFSWIEWPSKAACDAGSAKVMADPRMQPDANPMPFDAKRMIYGGFTPVVDMTR